MKQLINDGVIKYESFGAIHSFTFHPEAAVNNTYFQSDFGIKLLRRLADLANPSRPVAPPADPHRTMIMGQFP